MLTGYSSEEFADNSPDYSKGSLFSLFEASISFERQIKDKLSHINLLKDELDAQPRVRRREYTKSYKSIVSERVEKEKGEYRVLKNSRAQVNDALFDRAEIQLALVKYMQSGRGEEVTRAPTPPSRLIA